MSKITTILKREYLTRVRKKSFIVMTILGPILLASIMIIPIYLSQVSDKQSLIGVIDETEFFYQSFKSDNNIAFEKLNTDINTAKEELREGKYTAILFIPKGAISTPNTIRIIGKKNVSINIKTYIESTIKKELESQKLAMSGIDLEVLESIKTNVNIQTFTLGQEEQEKRTFSEVTTVLGLLLGILIYFFIFMFGSQVMRGVIEEKTSRIVEVIISSVKPFQLMMGKILGVALVGLTQFMLWVLLTSFIIIGFQLSNPGVFNQKQETVLLQNKGISPDEIAQINAANEQNQDKTFQLKEAIASINFRTIILMFLFFFIGGYLLYASLFAAVGSAVDNEADTQQFVLPITVPLILSIIMAQFIINNPDGPVAYWMSIIPFTSPIVMMIRIPFNPPMIDVIISCSLLIIGFIASTWFAAKIYRTGILMYGKKPTYKELWKWLRY
jgi:ABC-2 type transport system permease protein